MNGLFGSSVLEAAVGVASVYLILALFCSAANEWIAHLLNARASNFRQVIASMLSDQATQEGSQLLAAFYRHPVVHGSPSGKVGISQLAPEAFRTAIVDLATSHVEGRVLFSDLETGIRNLPAGPIRQTLLALTQNAAGDLSRAEAAIETWFNDNMRKASDWYRRRAQLWNLALAALVTLLTNADTLHLLHTFWSEPALRAAPPSNMSQLAPLIGWGPTSFHIGVLGWVTRVIGWLLTTLAVSLGAPFWFDAINKVANIRTGTTPPATGPARGTGSLQ